MRLFSFAILLVCVMTPLWGIKDVDPFGEPIISGSGIMLDLASGRVLYAKNTHKRIHPASTTKMATALMCYKILRNRLDETVVMTRDMVGAISPEKKRASNYTTPAHWIETASTHMGLKLGEEMTVRDLFKGCLVVSANDASNALALTACGSYSAFIEQLNQFVKELGCKDTKYLNPHGLFHPEQLTTTYDLALVARALMKEPFLRDVVSQTVFNRPKTNKQEPALMHNTHKLLRPGKYFCKWACGIKIGYTQESGGSIATCARNGDRSIILVLSDSPKLSDAFEDSVKLIHAAMTEKKNEQWLLRSGTKLSYELAVPGSKEPVQAVVKNDVVVTTYPSDQVSYKGVVHWQELVPPIRKGQFVGKLDVVTPSGEILASSQLIAMGDVEPTLIFKLHHWAILNPLKSIITGLIFAGGVSFSLLRRRLRR